MPVIYEYLGIELSFYSNEHQPVHIHATYGNAVMRVLLYTDGARITTIRYEAHTGKFPPPSSNTSKTSSPATNTPSSMPGSNTSPATET